MVGMGAKVLVILEGGRKADKLSDSSNWASRLRSGGIGVGARAWLWALGRGTEAGVVPHIWVPSLGSGFAPDSVLKVGDTFSEGVRPAWGGEGGAQSARGGGEFPRGDWEGLSSLLVISCEGDWLIQGLPPAHPSVFEFS